MRLILALICAAVCSTGLAQIQQQTTPNLINPTGTAWGIPPAQVLTSTGIGQIEGGGPTTGSAYYNSDTNTIRFSYGSSTVAQSIAISQALQGSGIALLGYQYSWQIMNDTAYAGGPLTGVVRLTNPSNQVLESYAYNYNPGASAQGAFQTFSGTQAFIPQAGYGLGQVGSISLSWTGQDNRFWNGLYGPRIRNSDLRLLYGNDICTQDPLSSPNCPGYAQAYFTQQCTANPLYNSGCPGYQQAYYTQQCTANPLSDPGCPGYAKAYFDQQCTANPLYNTQCPGYAQAYFTQQCSLNGLYDRNCPNYATAYATQQLTSKTNTTTVTTTVSDPVTAQTNPVAAQTNPVAVATTTANTTSSTSPTSVTSVTSVVVPAPAPQAPTAAPDAASKDTAKDTAKDSPAAPAPAPAASSSEPRSADSGRRDDRQNARASADTRAREVMRQAGDAKTLEAQAATQTAALALMGFVPGFEAYSQTRLPDPLMQQLQQKYGRSPVDNRRALWGLTGPSEQRWNQMVEDQYEIAK